MKEFWKRFQRVPARRRRTKRDEERYCLALYLLALATHRKLRYPLRVEEGESPDFIVTWHTGKKTGLDVTKATNMWVQPETTNADTHRDWFASVQRAVESCLPKLSISKFGVRSDLLVYDDTPLPAIDRPEALISLRDWLSAVKKANPLLGRVSVITSLDATQDCGNDLRFLPFINWSRPEATPDFGERVNFAGKKAVVTAIRQHESRGMPVYSTDSRGRLVKWMPNGTRYQVRVEPNGAEVVVGELMGK